MILVEHCLNSDDLFTDILLVHFARSTPDPHFPPHSSPILFYFSICHKSHPLYPLLALLLQQCELASARPDSPPPLDSFNAELKAYVQRQVELEEADLSKGPGTKTRDKNYYNSGNPLSFETSAYTAPNRSHSNRRYNTKLDGSGEHGFAANKASRPQSRDCRLHSTEKSRECDKSGLLDSDYNPDCGTDNALIDEDRKLNVFVNNSELDELWALGRAPGEEKAGGGGGGGVRVKQ
ncbi:Homeobox protein PKNOX1 [Fasciola gigantica]|uniref:Homeobox protein PKNOX1 n=1 Tax=Fasciola gigantica TaxID=46835 RepID=A0A504YH75_FASGI|nr:Homeobox protein PKNOX1 [Fasciola gigantica]